MTSILEYKMLAVDRSLVLTITLPGHVDTAEDGLVFIMSEAVVANCCKSSGMKELLQWSYRISLSCWSLHLQAKEKRYSLFKKYWHHDLILILISFEFIIYGDFTKAIWWSIRLPQDHWHDLMKAEWWWTRYTMHNIQTYRRLAVHRNLKSGPPFHITWRTSGAGKMKPEKLVS